jgi:hypothetical protein
VKPIGETYGAKKQQRKTPSAPAYKHDEAHLSNLSGQVLQVGIVGVAHTELASIQLGLIKSSDRSQRRVGVVILDEGKSLGPT